MPTILIVGGHCPPEEINSIRIYAIQYLAIPESMSWNDWTPEHHVSAGLRTATAWSSCDSIRGT